MEKDNNIAIIPPFIKTIKYGAFIRCSSLTSCFDACSSLKEVLFESPSSITSIGEYTLRKCSSLIQKLEVFFLICVTNLLY